MAPRDERRRNALVEEQCDRTLDETVAVMHKRPIPGSLTAPFRFLERHGIVELCDFQVPTCGDCLARRISTSRST